MGETTVIYDSFVLGTNLKWGKTKNAPQWGTQRGKKRDQPWKRLSNGDALRADLGQLQNSFARDRGCQQRKKKITALCMESAEQESKERAPQTDLKDNLILALCKGIALVSFGERPS